MTGEGMAQHVWVKITGQMLLQLPFAHSYLDSSASDSGTALADEKCLVRYRSVTSSG